MPIRHARAPHRAFPRRRSHRTGLTRAEPGAMMGFPCRPALLPHLSRAVMRCVRTRSASTSLGVSVIAGQLPAAGSRHRLGAPCRHVRWWLASDGHWGMVSYIPTALNVSMGVSSGGVVCLESA